MNDFAYGQALIFFKEDIEKINRKNNTHLILEQDGAPSHTSRSNINLLNESLGKMDGAKTPLILLTLLFLSRIYGPLSSRE